MSDSEDRSDSRALIGTAVIVIAIVVFLVVLNLTGRKPPPPTDGVNMTPTTSAPAAPTDQ